MNPFLAVAAFYGFSGVAMGAFAAHALKNRLDDYALGIMQTATHYQMVHAVAMLAVLALVQGQGKPMFGTLLCFSLGILIFSGSLYALALSGQKILGAITPIGGLLLLAGWLGLLLQGLRSSA